MIRFKICQALPQSLNVNTDGMYLQSTTQTYTYMGCIKIRKSKRNKCECKTYVLSNHIDN